VTEQNIKIVFRPLKGSNTSCRNKGLYHKTNWPLQFCRSACFSRHSCLQCGT